MRFFITAFAIFLTFISLISCSDNAEVLEPKTFSNIGYAVEGSDQEIVVTYRDFNNNVISDTTNVPWKKTFGSLTLEPDEEFHALFSIESLSNEEEELVSFIISDIHDFYSVAEMQFGKNLNVSLSNRFMNPTDGAITIAYANGAPTLYSVDGSDQKVEITYRDITNEIIVDTLNTPWEKRQFINIDPGMTFEAFLKVRSLSEDVETISASIRDINETQTDGLVNIELNASLPSRYELKN
ncbi:hypothetical protein [Rhodohalobacter barkolensis]|uniref:Uncharacterized protein n=1 Tax=Rhodohalobacter barkolensis TaxID=2053187 RepID=A0A2N0VHV0_9BACT|nr:hypothetical protein [Rhodohalobacter barkolensis]PKD43744.1 hypothetical protein CWD77_09300 [Rhodohalobacter barkolensis]